MAPKFIPITLGVRRSPEGMADGPGDMGASPALRQKIWLRDKNSCQYCGFVAERFQTIRVKDERESGDDEGNLVTACFFCAQCFLLDDVGMSGGGVLIWLPEIGQAALHHICRAIYVGREASSPINDAAQVAFDSLMVRRYEARRRVGTDDPLVMATVMHDMLNHREYSDRTTKLDGLRLLPLDKRMIWRGDKTIDQFPNILAYWKSADGPFAKMPTEKWLGLLASVNAVSGNA